MLAAVKSKPGCSMKHIGGGKRPFFQRKHQRIADIKKNLYGLPLVSYIYLTMMTPAGFEWDEVKATANVAEHGVSFEEAASVFFDHHTIEDDDGAGIGRLKAIGESAKRRLLVVVFVERGDNDRIISAWKATPEDRRRYDEERRRYER